MEGDRSIDGESDCQRADKLFERRNIQSCPDSIIFDGPERFNNVSECSELLNLQPRFVGGR